MKRTMLPPLVMLIVATVFLPQMLYAQSSRQTIEYALPRVVKIFGAGGVKNLQAYSTGMIVSPDGHIATGWSHVLDRDEVAVVLNDGRRFQAKVLGAEPPLDLAVLKIEEDGLELPFFDIESSVSAAPGTRVLGFSNMFQVAVGDEPVSVLHGVIAARTRLSARRGAFETPYDGPVYIVDAITNNAGAGGGALTTYDGKLLAMIGKELRDSRTNTWLNYAIPITELAPIIRQIISGDFTSNPRRDEPENPNRYHPLDFGLVMMPDVLFRTPAYVDSVVAETPAASAGLQRDDLVLFVNDQLVQSCRMLRDELGRLQAGDTLRLIVRRGDKLVSVAIPVLAKKGKANQ